MLSDEDVAGLDLDTGLIDAFDIEEAVLARLGQCSIDMTSKQSGTRLLVEAGIADDPAEGDLVFTRAKAIKPFGRDVRRRNPGLVEQARLVAVKHVHGGRRLDRYDLPVREREEKVAFLRVFARKGARPLLVRLALHEDVERLFRREYGGIVVEFASDGRNDSDACCQDTLCGQRGRLHGALSCMNGQIALLFISSTNN